MHQSTVVSCQCVQQSFGKVLLRFSFEHVSHTAPILIGDVGMRILLLLSGLLN